MEKFPAKILASALNVEFTVRGRGINQSFTWYYDSQEYYCCIRMYSHSIYIQVYDPIKDEDLLTYHFTPDQFRDEAEVFFMVLEWEEEFLWRIDLELWNPNEIFDI